MKLLSKDQIYQADRLTIERQGISSTDLMERAATEVFKWMHSRMQGAKVKIHVFCGIGNNGGDGLVLSRLLLKEGYSVDTYIVNYSDNRSKDFLVNYNRLKSVTNKWPLMVNEETSIPAIHQDDIIVDAIFGIGLNRIPSSWVRSLFKGLESSGAFILSIDIPSGLYMDKALDISDQAIKAYYTLSFQTPKLVFFLPETAIYTKQWEVLDIGLDVQFLSEVITSFQLIGKHEAIAMYKPRDRFAYKNNFGHALIIGGSYGKIGAIQLSAKACLYAGAGLVTAFIPQCGYQSLQTALPEVMVETDKHKDRLTTIASQVKASTAAIGMGMGTHKDSAEALEMYLKSVRYPIVLDADALNILAKHSNMQKLIPKESVLTPHRGELKRFIGEWDTDFDMLNKCAAFSKANSCVIVVKGAHSITVLGDEFFINTSGNPGMATAGSGDVLSGIIAGLLAQGYSSKEAALMGVYLHGTSGDIAVENTSYQSLTAGHLIEYLGKAFLSLFESSESTKN